MCWHSSFSILVRSNAPSLSAENANLYQALTQLPSLCPVNVFPTRYRSTSHGISAASGKVGAIIAQTIFGPLRNRGAPRGSTNSPWLNHVMEIFALFMLCGIFTTLLIPETKRKTLEELAGEVPGTAMYDPAFGAGAGTHNGATYEKDDERSSGEKNV